MLNTTVVTAVCVVLAALAGFGLGRRQRSGPDRPDGSTPAGSGVVTAPAVEAFSASLSEFSQSVTPLWSAHIESSRQQMETAVSALVTKFATIVTLLDA